jgi:hypothetical protein
MVEIEITEEMVCVAGRVLEADDGWVFGLGSAEAVAREMLERALAANSEASDEAPQ